MADGLVAIHLALVVPAAGGAVFALLSTLWVLAQAILRSGANAVAHAALTLTKHKGGRGEGGAEEEGDEEVEALQRRILAMKQALAMKQDDDDGGGGGGGGGGAGAM